MSQTHFPVMLTEVLNILCKKANGLYIDATFGRGGHTEAILNTLPLCQIIALDRDPDAINYGKEHLTDKYHDRISFLRAKFSELKDIYNNVDNISGILADLGVSSPQLDNADRGFSFNKEGALDMRMSKDGITAYDIINQWPEKELSDLFFYYGEEPKSRLIAKRIVERRKYNMFQTTTELADFIKNIINYQNYSKKHPATKVFQAIRMCVNDEINEIEHILKFGISVLELNGCIIVITFHSIEDRIVKRFFKSIANEYKISKKPLTPSEEEIKLNPRSRSAKLRYAIRRK